MRIAPWRRDSGAPLRAGAALMARARPADGPSLSHSLPGSIALGALNGAIGDVLAREHEELALPMALRRHESPAHTTASGGGERPPTV